MSAELDLGAYLRRVGLAAPPSVDLAGLLTLHFVHATTIPFENVDIQLGLPIRLDLGSLQAKLVQRRRGGYCFEHNTLLLRVLEALGYDVRPISARVRLGRPRDYTPARTHVFLRVELGGEKIGRASCRERV